MTRIFNMLIKQRIYINRSIYTLVKPTGADTVTIQNITYKRDDFTNVSTKILSLVGRNLHVLPKHPLSLVRQKIVNYFYKVFVNTKGNPLFSVYDNLPPVVTSIQNFDSLLTPLNHPSRLKSDCYYINREYLLRGHTTAHQTELIKSGLNNFLMIGDVYRRDEINATHYPVFHQLDAVRLKTRDEIFAKDDTLQLFNNSDTATIPGGQVKQDCHTLEASKLIEHELKSTLVGLAKELFGQNIQYRWIDTTFPFTQPSWELEVYWNNNWLELLGCGIMMQSILKNSGVHDRVGWAFGIGLERIAMCLYQIPDIRLFWSSDTGFLSQFKTDDLDVKIVYKPISQYPQCTQDMSFWLPEDEASFNSNDYYEIVRNVGGDIVEQVMLIDQFRHPGKNKTSHCYRIVYRHMERTLTNKEVHFIHNRIANAASKQLGVICR